MRSIILLSIFCLSACDDEGKTRSGDAKEDRNSHSPVVPVTNNDTRNDAKVYSNQRFKNVTVKKLSGNSYRLRGEGQIFEASFNWVIEDGHNELLSGYSTTDGGAPAWGKFDFTINVSKQRENSVLHIILFEASAEDGRRTHELPIILP